MSMNGRPLSRAQAALWAEIQESPTGGLWIRHNGRYRRTVLALERRGLVEATDYGKLGGFYEPAKREQ